MKKELFDQLLESVKEAVAIERGTRTPSRKFEVKSGIMTHACTLGIQIKAIRIDLK